MEQLAERYVRPRFHAICPLPLSLSIPPRPAPPLLFSRKGPRLPLVSFLFFFFFCGGNFANLSLRRPPLFL